MKHSPTDVARIAVDLARAKGNRAADNIADALELLNQCSQAIDTQPNFAPPAPKLELPNGIANAIRPKQEPYRSVLPLEEFLALKLPKVAGMKNRLAVFKQFLVETRVCSTNDESKRLIETLKQDGVRIRDFLDLPNWRKATISELRSKIGKDGGRTTARVRRENSKPARKNLTA
jgi:hypothetical protein